MDNDDFGLDFFIETVFLENLAFTERFRIQYIFIFENSFLFLFLVLVFHLGFTDFLLLAIEVVSIDFAKNSDSFIKNALRLTSFELRIAFSNNRNQKVKHNNL